MIADVGELPPLPEPLAALVDRWVCNESDRGRPRDLFGRGGDTRLGPAIYVGRNFAGREDNGFGNPLRVPKGEAAGATLVAYHRWVLGPSVRAAVLRRRIADELPGRPLACWCHPKPCHAWLLCGWANDAGDAVDTWIAAVADHIDPRSRR